MSRFDVRVKPKSSRFAILGCRDGVWQVALTSPPEGGKANRELLKAVSKALGISKSRIGIAVGDKSRNKTLSVNGLGEDEIRERLQAASRLS